jgi:hypothetical protein
MQTVDFVIESNRIEGIKDTTPAQIAEHKRFVALKELSVAELCAFVNVYQPNAVLRNHKGLDVRVGNHFPPLGGPEVAMQLTDLIARINEGIITDPYRAHVEYETLHPFTDCNGRSGRVLWYWMMRNDPTHKLGFLHVFYYQALQNSRVGEIASPDNHTRKSKRSPTP